MPDGEVACLRACLDSHGRLTICSLFAGRRCLCQWRLSVNCELPDLLQHSYRSARSCSKVPIAPMGKLLTCLARLSLAHRSTPGGTCSGDLESSHRPDGKIADVLAWTLASTTAADAPVNYRLMYVPQRLQISHRPNGIFTCFALVLAGWWCLRPKWHGDHLIVNHQWEHSWLCAHSSSKVPNAPMGNSRFARCLQGGGVYVTSGTVTITSSSIYGNTVNGVRAHVQKFPSPR